MERDFLVRLESFPYIESVESQPFTLAFEHEGKQLTYTPDFKVTYLSHPWPVRKTAVFEVKLSKRLLDDREYWKPRFIAAMRHCREHGRVFHLMNERKIRDQRWANSKFLRRYRHYQFEQADIEAVLDTADTQTVVTSDYLLSKHFPGDHLRPIGISLIWHLVANQKLECDMTAPLTHLSELWRINVE